MSGDEPALPIADAIEPDLNPYASPMSAGAAPASKLPPQLWRSGNLVVAHRQAVWPRRCVKTAAPANHPMTLPVATRYPAWLLLVFFGALGVGLIVSLSLPFQYTGTGIGITIVGAFAALFLAIALLARPGQIVFYVGDELLSQRRRRLLVSKILTALGAVLFFATIIIGESLPGMGYAFFASIAVFVAGSVIHQRWPNLLRPVTTQPEYITLRGCGPAFLDSLPQWPFGPV